MPQTGAHTWPALLLGFVADWHIANGQAGWITNLLYAAYTVSVPFPVTRTDLIDPRSVYLTGVGLTMASLAAFIDCPSREHRGGSRPAGADMTEAHTVGSFTFERGRITVNRGAALHPSFEYVSSEPVLDRRGDPIDRDAEPEEWIRALMLNYCGSRLWVELAEDQGGG